MSESSGAAVPGEALEFGDIQGLIFFGHGHLKYSRYVFLRVKDGQRARAWLRTLVERNEVTTASGKHHPGLKDVKGAHALQIAFTAPGLEALGVGCDVMTTFLQEFREGMRNPRRVRILGDTGGSAPEKWQFGSSEPTTPHLVLALFAGDPKSLTALHDSHRERYEKALEELFIQDADMRQGDTEPFGFRDGISFPYIKGVPTTRTSDALGLAVNAGEFILGYHNAYDQYPFSPRVPANQDPDNLLPEVPREQAVPGKPRPKDLGRNGTYMVIRKLSQDVTGFWKFIEENSRDPHKSPEENAANKELLAAKLMGRWKSGAPLMLCPMKDDPKLGEDPMRGNHFTFREDPQGLKCPFSSHVRRSNPRDTLVKDPEESIKLVSRHLIIRRGRPYHDKPPARAEEQGLLFVALNTNIGRQFEFIQQTWMNNPKFGDLYESKDPIVGDNYDPQDPGDEPKDYTAVVPGFPVRQRITGVPRFVHMRGGEYFFLPGIKALRYLSAEHAR
ncbi:Dyp-type peroxidase [Archangium sp.]|uniref:Dyp-type peroxidase n=1 Tax=Archangium sp. TaxID=1872627 RepID=UPI002D44F638|nr:Dyp-type peroxidase [Archangium sp.]HYO55229.1 Dyp-type peroxidase [Archangium sp.]